MAIGLFPTLRQEFMQYPAVYRSQEGLKATRPVGLVAMFVAVLFLAFLYATRYPPGSSFSLGVRFGARIGIFAVCAFVLHNDVGQIYRPPLPR